MSHYPTDKAPLASFLYCDDYISLEMGLPGVEDREAFVVSVHRTACLRQGRRGDLVKQGWKGDMRDRVG